MPTAMAVMGRSARMESGSVAATSSSSARNVVGVKEAIGSTAGAELPAPICFFELSFSDASPPSASRGGFSFLRSATAVSLFVVSS